MTTVRELAGTWTAQDFECLPEDAPAPDRPLAVLTSAAPDRALTSREQQVHAVSAKLSPRCGQPMLDAPQSQRPPQARDPLLNDAHKLQLSPEARELLPYVLASGPEARRAFAALCQAEEPDVRGFFRAQLLDPMVDIPPRLHAVAVGLLELDRTLDTPTLELAVARFPAVMDLPDVATILSLHKLDAEARELAVGCLRQGGWRAKAAMRSIREAKQPSDAVRFVASPVFGELTAVEQSRLLEYFTLDVPAARLIQQGLVQLVTAQGAKPNVTELRRWLDKNATIPNRPPTPPVEARPYTVRQIPIYVSTRQGPAPHPTLARYTITVGRRAIPVIALRSPPSGMVSLETLGAALSIVPEPELALISQIDMTRPSDPKYAWGANPLTRQLSVYPVSYDRPLNDVARSVRHEMGHLVSFAFLGSEQSSAGWSSWRRAAAQDALDASHNARIDAREDFAETWVIYQQSLGTPAHTQLRKLYRERFLILDEIQRKLHGQPGNKAPPASEN